MKSEAPDSQHTEEDLPKNAPKPGPTPPPPSSESLAAEAPPPPPQRTALAFEDTLHTEAKPRAAQAQGIPLVEVSAAHYEVSGEFARGGLGRILRAKDLRLGRQVAIKELLHASQARERFLQEALITARLQHPSIVPIYEAGVWPSGEPFYSMKLVSGKPLHQLIEETPTLDARLSLLPKLVAVTEAIAYAHSLQIIHRDLKPHNILIGEFGEAIVIDWGLAKDLSIPSHETVAPTEDTPKPNNGPFTLAGSILGTPGYMPPEQARGEPVDTRADVYSLGAILYHLLAGCAPLSGKGPVNPDAEIVPLEVRQPEVPVELLTIVRRSMARRADERYPSAKALLEELQRFTSGSLLRSHPYSTRELWSRWLKRYRAPVFVAVIAALLLGLLGAISIQNIQAAKDTSEANLLTAKELNARLQTKIQEHEQVTQRLLQEMGREQLADGHFLRAAFFLSESLRHAELLGTPPLGLRALLQRAMPSIEALLLTLEAEAPLSAAAFSPDGRLLAALGGGSVSVWEAQSGHRLFVLPSANNRKPPRFVLGGAGLVIQTGEQAQLWDANSGVLLRTFGEDHSMPKSVAISPDGQRLALVYARELRVYQLSSGELLASRRSEGEATFEGALFTPSNALLLQLLYGHPSDLEAPEEFVLWELGAPRFSSATTLHADSFSLSPDGTVLFAQSHQGLTLLSLPALDVLRVLPRAKALSLSPDNKLVATLSPSEDAVTLWDISAGLSLWTFPGHSGQLIGACFSPDSKTLATTGTDGVIKLWDVSSGQLFASLEAHREAVSAVVFSPDGTRLLSASKDKTARLWSTRLQPWSQSLNASTKKLQELLFSSDGAFLASRGFSSFDMSVDIWRGNGERLTSIRGESGLVDAIAISPDNSRLVLALSNSLAEVYDLNGAKLFSLIGHHGSVDSAAFSFDGKKILTAGRDPAARVWDAATGAPLLTLALNGKGAAAAVFSHKAKLIATSAARDKIALWDAETGARLRSLESQEGADSLSFSLDDRLLLARNRDNQAIVWDVQTGAQLMTMESNANDLSCVVFAPDQRHIFTADREGTVRLWDISTGQQLGALLAHSFSILSLEFSHDGKRLLTISSDKTAKLWDISGGNPAHYELLFDLRGHSAIVAALFSPDDATIATAGEDGTVKLWPLTFETRDAWSLRRVLENRAPWQWTDGELQPN